MPQRLKAMQNDVVNFTVATVTAGWAWVTAETLAIIVPCLWALYVLMLIAKTLPDVLDKHPWVLRSMRYVWRFFAGIVRRFVGLFRRGAS